MPQVTGPVFDAHLHIVDPAHPLVENGGYLLDPFTVADYRERIAGLGIAGGAVVSGSFQAFEQGYLVDALAALGPGFVGVTQIPSDTSDARILSLHDAGVRAVRFNVARSGSGTSHSSAMRFRPSRSTRCSGGTRRRSISSNSAHKEKPRFENRGFSRC
jgi:predicted TIM-barrel fold metal-dependent hydrolase